MFCLLYRSVNGPTERIFSVSFEGGAVTSDPIDIIRGSGFKFTAFALAFAVTVSDGELNIGFNPTVQNPQICGIEIRILPSPDPIIQTFPFYISAGPSYTSTTTTKIWVADASYVTGGTVGIGPQGDILNTVEDGLYRKERVGDTTMAYKIPIVNGNYRVVLHFAEL
jgi:Malectin domain